MPTTYFKYSMKSNETSVKEVLMTFHNDKSVIALANLLSHSISLCLQRTDSYSEKNMQEHITEKIARMKIKGDI